MMKIQNFSAQDVQKLLNKKDKHGEDGVLMQLKQFLCHTENQETICTPVHRFFKVYKKNMIEVVDLMHIMKDK
ncbi:hypothetical protein PORY_002174 [Pneumocystis oryctolagi]|uniref:Uncharacterized protein n=1 Tax=Pneumocystis oryctolagi TaxID=42067 RepID=A0ACB7C9S2_9ASCO|nr:hypothetical protein PORY_002174 [Pneumocystis oryctolagi]